MCSFTKVIKFLIAGKEAFFQTKLMRFDIGPVHTAYPRSYLLSGDAKPRLIEIHIKFALDYRNKFSLRKVSNKRRME